MPIIRILHVAGSPYNDFYCELSRNYAQSSLVAAANPSRYEFLIAYITPDRQWRFPSSLSLEDIAVAKPVPLLDAIQFITAQNIDLMLPQMFCIPGMTEYRALFDLLRKAPKASAKDFQEHIINFYAGGWNASFLAGCSLFKEC